MSVRPQGWVLGTLALIAIHLTARQGRAADPPRAHMQDAPAPPDATEWYGAPVVVTDVAALALFVGGMVSADHGSKAGSGLMLAGLGTYLIGGPTVHLVQHRATTGIASFALRAATPLAAGVAGGIVGGGMRSRVGHRDYDNDGLGGPALGFAQGAARG